MFAAVHAKWSCHKNCIHSYADEVNEVGDRQGRRSLRKSAGAMGGTFFGVNFYCIFGRFGKMTYLVNSEKCRGSSPGCPGWCGAPDFYNMNIQMTALGKWSITWITFMLFKRSKSASMFLLLFHLFFPDLVTPSFSSSFPPKSTSFEQYQVSLSS